MNAPERFDRIVTVRELAVGKEMEWDRLAERLGGAVYHRAAWGGLIAEVFGKRPVYLSACNIHGDLVGLLPLVHMKSALFGNYFVSLPYFNYGGAIALDAAVEAELMRQAGDWAEEAGATHVEFRDLAPRGGWQARTDKVCMWLELPSDPDALWSALGPKRRAQIRRPLKEGATARVGGADLIRDFYSVFARNMRDLGTPVYPRRFFDAIHDRFPEAAKLLVIYLGGRPVAGGFLLADGEKLEIPWASSLREANPLGANMLLYWEALRYAIVSGYRRFDFGRSTVDSGTFRFKRQWGAEPVPLYWHYWLAPGRRMPRLSPDNPKYRMAIAAWRRLPVTVSNWLGPRIVRHLP